MKKLIYIITIMLVSNTVLAQTTTENYVKSTTPQVEVQTEAALNNLPADDKIEAITYFDGLGRPIQSIAKQAGGQKQDIITPIVYDEFGRQMKEYLPYTRTNSSINFAPSLLPDSNGDITALNTQYLAKYPQDLTPNTQNPYSEKVLEASPLNRILEQAAPGTDWAVGNGHTIKFDYQTNSTGEVRRFSVAHPNDNTEQTELVCEGHYEANTLYKTITKDENWVSSDGNNHTTEEYKNKQGQVLLKRTYANTPGSRTPQAHDTQYVYDDFGNLTYVIPPEASDDIVEMQRNSQSSVQTNYSWITMAEVDKAFADAYNRRFFDYDNADLLALDLDNKHGAQGGFTINTNNSNDVVTMSISLSTTSPLTLKQGQLLSLKDYGNYKDTELGRIRGNNYSYTFYIRNNTIYISGKGQVSHINTSFNSSNTLDYTQNLDWSKLINEKSPSNAQGGITLSIDQDDNISLSLNLSSNSPISFKKGQLIPLGTKRRIDNRPLGNVTINSNDYTFSIEDNSLKIEGTAPFTNLTYSTYSSRGTLGTNTCSIDTKVLEGYSYIYHYDYRNRLIEKKIPGKGWEHIVYDKLDRPILTQDAKQRQNKQWLVTTYDALGRVAYTGLWQAGYYMPSRSSLQNNINTNTNNSPLYETRQNTGTTQGGTTMYYSNQSHYANQITSLHTINYYDHYDDVGLSGEDLVKQEGDMIYDATIALNTKGLAVVSKVRVLDTNDWITSVSYFDEKGMPIYVASENSYLSSTDYVKTDYDFTGKVLKTESTHKKGTNPQIVIEDTFTYDHAGRLLTQTQSIDQGTAELIVNNHYDALGQLQNKNVGGNVATTVEDSQGLQTVDYKYNIRGWLKTINNGGAYGTDLFGTALHYNNPSSGGTALYNGNISQISWRSASDNNQYRVYRYKYDALNRITKADFAGAEGWASFRLDNLSYDKNGNILSLRRRGLVEATDNFDYIDILNYNYAPYSNTLLAVNDTATTDGFKDGNTKGDDYKYDVNGNLVADRNKDILEIQYNHLNLPKYVKIEGDETGTISYVYDAAGTKLAKIVDNHNQQNQTTTTQYAGSFIYEDNQLKMFATPEGYVEPDGNGGYNYAYQYKDHLGNVRLTYADSDGNGLIDPNTEIISEKNYYPFGGLHKGYNNVTSAHVNSAASKFMFGGKEYQNELGLGWYDITARNYDPDLGRWMNIDPLAEFMFTQSPYNYAFNNPIYFIDPDGLMPYKREVGWAGYYDDGHGNVVFDPNINNQKDLDALGIEGASYIGSTYYDSSDGTLYDENGEAHKYRCSYSSCGHSHFGFLGFFKSLDGLFQGSAIDHIGSGFVLRGKGNSNKSNNVSDNPDEDIEIPAEVVAALRGITGKHKGAGKNLITTFQNGMKDTKKVKRIVEEIDKLIDGKKTDGNGNTKNTLETSNYTVKDTTRYIIEFWKNGAYGGSEAYGKNKASKKAKEAKNELELDSVTVKKAN